MPYFIESGFADIGHLVFLMHTNYPINDNILKQIGINKIGHRQRILLKLKEESKNAMKNISFIITENESNNIACGFCIIY